MYLDYGLDFYAPQSFLDKDNRRTLLAWLRMREPITNEKWIGMFTMPRILTSYHHHIYQRVHPNIQNQFTKVTETLDFQEPFLMKTILKENEEMNIGGLKLYIQDDCLCCDRTKISIQKNKVCNVNQTPKLNHQYQLDIYYDYHIFEIFINDGYYVLSQIVYQILEDQTHYNKEVTTILQIR